ncbi:putative ABC transport system substrate-binding protein [Enhydrobacter aerosaccus]|uniref:Putative ABC transport system substrate-binding protein n=1 Tax=Enhydrobacter aerosaccus TaxID=225324 RepID=A0A1T4TMG2_9HYPH|nr:ABC transporter substrate-binding protein [Enhydrobacter aerosaccus]SKA41577.1 putative ABC transport system substrate-binding protein [Enhydrobacter aerosaccus]
MNRRALLSGLTAAAALPARAQGMPRIGFLVTGDPEPVWSLFRAAMAKLGYSEGRTVAYEYRAADAAGGRLDAFAADLVRLKVDVLVAVLSPAIAAAKRATSRLPIVFYGAAPDTGMVTNMARPETNVTGVFSPSATLAGKAVQLFHEIKPQTKLFGVLLNALDPFHVPLRQEVEAVTRAEKIEAVPVLVGKPEEVAPALESMARRGLDGVLVQPSLGMVAAAASALKYRLPAISFRREFVEAGGLLSYGGNQQDMAMLLAEDVDKLLKGAPVAALPVRQTDKVELVINLTTAKTLGLTLSPLFLARVDEVIE